MKKYLPLLLFLSCSIIVNAQLHVDATFTNCTANGMRNGTATVTVTGGTAPYKYSWNTVPVQTNSTVTNLSVGSYNCTVTDASGTVSLSKNILIAQPDTLKATATSTDKSNYGISNGTATVVPMGGTPPYTYSWNTVPIQMNQYITNLPNGSYYCTVTDANGILCTTRPVIISQPLYIDEVNSFGEGPSFKKGDDGSIHFSVSNPSFNPPLNFGTHYLICYTINGTETDTAKVELTQNKSSGNKELILPKLTIGNYSNIKIIPEDANVGPVAVSKTFNLVLDQLLSRKAIQIPSISAAIFYNYSGIANDFPTGYTQYYISGSCGLRKKDGIPRDAKGNEKLIFFRSFYGSFSYTDPSAFSLKTVDLANNRHVNQLDLYTHANVNLSPNLNLLTYIISHQGIFGDDAHLYLDANFSFLNTNVTDSVSSTVFNTYSVKSHIIGLSVAIKSTNFLNAPLQLLATANIFGIYQNSNAVIYDLGTQYANISDTANAQNSSKKLFIGKRTTPYIGLSGELMYNINGVTKNSASNIYLRFSFISNYADAAKSHYSNAFWSLQIGYLLSLDKLFYPQTTTPAASVNSIKGPL
ncbi:MAG TPA: SprB repeat-containing protein [Ferruginibacter sp.]|nr:SprB repeat-containing protein [Ferruginibacter sp.]